MNDMDPRLPHPSRLTYLIQGIRWAFAEFLTLPALVVAVFLIAAAATCALDHATEGPTGPFRRFMERHVFRNAKATSDLLGTVATGLITVVSITFSLLLLAVQQSAASLTNQVFDQFLRRRFNQFIFGFFVGLTLDALIILSTVDPPYNPVYGATLALLLTAVALLLLIVLLYTTIDQMRPDAIIEAIHGHTLTAAERHRDFLQTVHAASRADRTCHRPVQAPEHGYVVRIDARAMAEAAAKSPGWAEVILCTAVGSFVGFRDVIAELRLDRDSGADELERVVRRSVVLERQRDLDHDPAFGVEQLHTIAWTSISTAKSNPYPGLLVIRSLRDLLARWSDEGPPGPGGRTGSEAASRVVYADDIPGQAMDALESLTVSASESMLHLTLAEICRNLGVCFGRLTPHLRTRAEELILRSLSAMGDHVLTTELDQALRRLTDELDRAGRRDTAVAVRAARDRLGASVGVLNSRATRVRGKE